LNQTRNENGGGGNGVDFVHLPKSLLRWANGVQGKVVIVDGMKLFHKYLFKNTGFQYKVSPIFKNMAEKKYGYGGVSSG